MNTLPTIPNCMIKIAGSDSLKNQLSLVLWLGGDIDC